MLTICFAGQRCTEPGRRYSTRSALFEEPNATCESPPSGNPHILHYLRLQYRSEANCLLDPRLTVLAQTHNIQSQELGIDSNCMEAISASVYRTCRSRPTRCWHYGTGHQRRLELPERAAPSRRDGCPSLPDRVLIGRDSRGRSSRLLCLPNAQPYLLGTQPT